MIRKTFCLFLALSMVLWTPALYAGLCRTGSCRPRHVVQRFRVVDSVNVLQKNVEFDADYFLGLDGYYDVVDELQQQDYARDKDIILKQAEQVDKLIGLLEQALRGDGPVPPPVEPPILPPPTPTDPPVDLPTPTDTSSLDTQVFHLFSKSCNSCHGPTSPKAGLQLVGEDPDGTKWLNDLSLEDRVLVYDHVAGINLADRGKKLMPLGGPVLPDEDVELTRLWMIAKAEELKRGNR